MTMAKKVLIMTQNFYPVIGSAGNRMKNIFQLLNENNIEADVLTTVPAYPNKNLYKDSIFWDDETLNNSTQITRVPIKNKHFSNRMISRLWFYLEIMYRFLKAAWKLRKENYGYILVSTPPIFIVFSALVAKKILRTKLILEVRDLWPDSLVGVKAFNSKWIIKVFRFLERKMYRKADYIIINSQGFENHIKRNLKHSTSLIYLPNGPRQNEIIFKKSYHGQFRVVYTGNLGLAQDVDRLKRIARLLSEKNIRMDIIGYGMRTDEFIAYLKEQDIQTVHVHKPTTRKKSLKLIENSNLALAFLNDDDVFSTVLPGKIIDYMACRTPIVAGVKGVAAELIHVNKVGFIYDRKDVHQMVEKIVELRDNPQMLEQLGENCTKTIMQQFVWEKNINKLTGIIQ